MNIEGIDTTTGIVGLIENGSQNRDAEIVRILRSQGAVLFCKTSVPQASFAGETINNIIEYTWNPVNRNLSAGGSSGGEGALIALKGSPLGFGTDIGGSIRVPAAFNGLYGLKPSTCRLPFEGIRRVMEGQDFAPFSLGPLATSVKSLEMIMKVVLRQEPWLQDPRVVEIPWRQVIGDTYSKKTCIKTDFRCAED